LAREPPPLDTDIATKGQHCRVEVIDPFDPDNFKYEITVKEIS
jgi:hypothetical protein